MSLFGDRKIGADYVAPKTSVYGIQRASLFKRLAAFLLDIILCSILTLGIATVMSNLVKYDALSDKLQDKYIEFNVGTMDETGMITLCEFPIQQEGESDEDYINRCNEDSCYQSYLNFTKDEEVKQLQADLFQKTLIITSLSLLLATALVYLLFPLLFKNGQTLGMKFVQEGLVTNKGVKVEFTHVFLRWSMGIFVIETMIPIYSLIYILLTGQGIAILAIFNLLLLLLNLVIYVLTPNHIFIHDLIGGTCVIDMNTQVIANSIEEAEDNIKRELDSRR